MGQLHLQKVVLHFIIGSENEVCLIRSLLACSPLLKRMKIVCRASEMLGGDSKERIFAMKLLKLHRASPIAEIDIQWWL